MSFKKTINREFEVALSKNSQPIWFRVLKYILLGGVIYFFRESAWMWIILTALLIVALIVHFWVRYKTKGWTQSYGLWKYEKNKPRDP